MEILKEKISFEEHTLSEMKKGNAKVMPDWQINDQEAFVGGMNYALKIVQEARNNTIAKINNR